MLRYAITDGRVLEYGGSALLWKRAEYWASRGVDYIQLREKEVSPAGLVKLAGGVLRAIEGSKTKLLINGRTDVAIAVGAHGVHLTSAPGEMPPSAVRTVYEAAGLKMPIITASAHSPEQVDRVVGAGVDFVLFGPVFGKMVGGEEFGRRLGLDALNEACSIAGKRVLALGGITDENKQSTIDAGAVGIAAIRLFAKGTNNQS